MKARKALSCLAVALGIFVSSCTLSLPWPDEYRRSEGDYVVAYSSPDVEDAEMQELLATADSAWLTVLEVCQLRIVLRPTILVDQAGPMELHFAWSSYYQYGASVHLNDNLLSSGRQYARTVLRHELAHLAVGVEYGDCDSFVLTEGIAMYVEARGKPVYWADSQERSSIGTTLARTHGEVTAAWESGAMDNDDVDRLYGLSGLFTRYWIERFGLESWHSLYTGYVSAHVGDSVEAACGVPFEEVCDGFSTYEP